MCPRDSPFPNEKDVIRTLSYNKLHAFDFQTHGQFFWNFRTEFETRWDFQRVSETAYISLRTIFAFLRCFDMKQEQINLSTFLFSFIVQLMYCIYNCVNN